MKKKNIQIYIIMLIAILNRVFLFGSYPGGVNVDEAYAGYESWSLVNYGMDSWGYKNPVYFIACGGGMNTLNSYLMMPLVALFGLNKYTIRIPQMILGILTVYIIFAYKENRYKGNGMDSFRSSCNKSMAYNYFKIWIGIQSGNYICSVRNIFFYSGN